MRRKIVIEVQNMHNDQARAKVMKIAVAAQGVTSVSIGANNELEVTGEEVDAVCLANSLRKKFCYVKIISIAAVTPPRPAPPPPPPPPTAPPLPPTAPPLPQCFFDRPGHYDAPFNCSMF